MAGITGSTSASPATGTPGRASGAGAAAGTGPTFEPGRLRRVLAGGGFAVTAEISPPRGASTAPVTATAALLAGWADAVNLTDNQGASVRLSSWAGSLAALAAGVAPIMQLTCRDRNRIALQSELISAAAVGIPNVVLMTGDSPAQGDHPDATGVFDLNSTELLRAATGLRDGGTLLSGRRISPPPDWFLGAVESPAGPPEAAVARLAAKVAAGAQFIQTQFVFDVPAFARWLDRAAGLGLLEHCHVLAGVGPVLSLPTLAYLRRGLPGAGVPEAVAQRLESAGPAGIAAAGQLLCAQTIAELHELPGLGGVHVMAMGREQVIPAILAQAGLSRDGRGNTAGTVT